MLLGLDEKEPGLLGISTTPFIICYNFVLSFFTVALRRCCLANINSAKKRIRQNEKARLRNRIHRGRARAQVRQAREAIATGDTAASAEAVREAVRWLDHAASKGVIHPNNAARRKGRLMKRLAALEAQAK
jgi:small subunit ribosomal protein S20